MYQQISCAYCPCLNNGQCLNMPTGAFCVSVTTCVIRLSFALLIVSQKNKELRVSLYGPILRIQFGQCKRRDTNTELVSIYAIASSTAVNISVGIWRGQCLFVFARNLSKRGYMLAIWLRYR